MSQSDFADPPQPDAGAVQSPPAGGSASAAARPAVAQPAAAQPAVAQPGVAHQAAAHLAVAQPAAARPAAWPRRYAIMSRTAIVGYTDLEVPVTHGERAAGLVVPASGFGAVHNVFALYHEAGSDRELLSRFVEARDSLGLMLTDGSALPLAARVELISVSDPHRIVVHVVVKDERYWALLRGGGASGTAAPGAGVVGRPPSPWSALHTPAASGTGPGLARPSWLSAWARPEGSRPITAQSVQTAQPAQSARPAQDGASPPRGFAGPAAGPA